MYIAHSPFTAGKMTPDGQQDESQGIENDHRGKDGSGEIMVFGAPIEEGEKVDDDHHEHLNENARQLARKYL